MLAMKKLVLATLIQGASATVLTADTFDLEALHPTRSAFVLFYAPWCGPPQCTHTASHTRVTYTYAPRQHCGPRRRHASAVHASVHASRSPRRCGHCKAMKPAWNEFSKLHAKSAELLVGEVDCTAGGGEELCERFEVEGFPTLKFFEAGSSEPEEFDGDEMTVEGFETYSKALLGPACSPSALEVCSAEDRKIIESYRALSPEARAAEQGSLALPLAAAKAEVKQLEKETVRCSPGPNPSPNPDTNTAQVKRLEKESEELEEREEAAGERLEELKKSSKRSLTLMQRVDAADAAAKLEL